jgi:hypothetical protein
MQVTLVHFWKLIQRKGKFCQKCEIKKCENDGKMNLEKCKCDCVHPSFGTFCEKKSVILFTNSFSSLLLNNHILDIANFHLKIGNKVTIGYITNPVCLNEPCGFQNFKKLLNRKINFIHIGKDSKF